MLYRAVQRVLIEMGEAACYALGWAILAAEKGLPVSIVEDFLKWVERKWVYYNWDNPEDSKNCYVENPGAIVSYYFGGIWVVTHEAADYIPKPGELAQARYERIKTGAVLGHFVPLKPDGAILRDPMGESATVKYGTRVSTRVARKIG